MGYKRRLANRVGESNQPVSQSGCTLISHTLWCNGIDSDKDCVCHPPLVQRLRRLEPEYPPLHSPGNSFNSSNKQCSPPDPCWHCADLTKVSGCLCVFCLSAVSQYQTLLKKGNIDVACAWHAHCAQEARNLIQDHKGAWFLLPFTWCLAASQHNTSKDVLYALCSNFCLAELLGPRQIGNATFTALTLRTSTSFIRLLCTQWTKVKQKSYKIPLMETLKHWMDLVHPGSKLVKICKETWDCQ
eukprot:3966613-Amphidinium_carterae.1